MGISVKNGRLITSVKFLGFAYILKAIFIGLILLLSFQPEIDLWYTDNYLMQVIVIFLIIAIIITTYKLTHITSFTRSKVKKLYALINSASLALIIILLLPLIGIWNTLILLILPITGYAIFNLVLYGKPLQPLV